MVRLFQFPANRSTLNYSPFCLKLETYLRMAKIPYEVKVSTNPWSAPKKKLPFVEVDGKRIADSAFIIDYLKGNLGDPLDDGLTKEQKAVSHAITRMLEEDLAPVLVYSRWVDEPGWKEAGPRFFKGLPPPVKWVVPELARRKVRARLAALGLLAHSREEIYAKGAQDLKALSDYLGDKPYFLGDRPTTVDASAFGVLNNVIKQSYHTPLKELGVRHPNLVAYCERMGKAYYSQ